MMRALILLSIICHAFCVPIVKKKLLSEEKLKQQLGDADFQAFRQHLTKEKFDAMKEYIHMKPEEREKFVKQLLKEHEQRMQHETVYEPGSQPQLKEVWRDEDHMSDDTYSPLMLFKKHDLNEDHFLDEHEINALVEHEIEKVYPLNSTEDADLRDLELRRMRKAFMERMDHNHDGLISVSELLTPIQDDDDDDEWTPLEDYEELPDFEHKTDDKYILDYAQEQLNLHPDDPELEEIMHKLHGVKGVPDTSHPPPKSYSELKASNSAGGAVHPPPAAPSGIH